VRAGRAAWLAVAVACAWPAARAAEPTTLYVVEQLVVNVNSAPDASGERIATVKSGEALEVIEKSGEQVHVKLANGRDGWVRAGYLSADPPLRPRLAQREAEVAQLKDELGRLQTQLAAARPATTVAAAASAPAPAPPAAEDGASAPRALFDAPSDAPPRSVWPWALGWSLAALALGFVLGAVVLDRHIRRKYGGLRIY